MSRVYFDSPSGEAELLGAERGWLRHLAMGPARTAWDVNDFDRACEVMEMVLETSDSYLHDYWRSAAAQNALNMDAADFRPETYHSIRQFVDALAVALRVVGVELEVAGIRLHSYDLDLNTALLAGSDPVRLAAKIQGWCESHAWVDGPDRNWMADIIDDALTAGLYRTGMGWDQVVALLRSRDDEPVVLSYSVTDSFPHLPGDTDEERWQVSFAALQSSPWLQMSPESLGEQYFGRPVTVYDVLAGDRDKRVLAAVDQVKA